MPYPGERPQNRDSSPPQVRRERERNGQVPWRVASRRGPPRRRRRSSPPSLKGVPKYNETSSHEQFPVASAIRAKRALLPRLTGGVTRTARPITDSRRLSAQVRRGGPAANGPPLRGRRVFATSSLTLDERAKSGWSLLSPLPRLSTQKTFGLAPRVAFRTPPRRSAKRDSSTRQSQRTSR
jgi:hypothetical protein